VAAKTPNFAVFWTSAFSGVANWKQSDKVEHGCTTTNLTLCNGIEIVSVLQRKFGVLEQTQRLHLQAKFHLNVFIVSASGGQKP